MDPPRQSPIGIRERVVVTAVEGWRDGTSSAPGDAGKNDDLLLKTSETVLQMAGIARINEVNEEARVFYSHLGFHCVRFRDHVRRASQTSSRLNGELVNQALRHLNSLVPETGLQELQPYTQSYTVTLKFRLGALNLHWSEIRKQHDDANLEFIRRWLKNGASEKHRSEVDKALESCADDLDKQQPEHSFKKSAEKFASPDIGEPSYAVWKTAQSIFDALSDCKGCSCPSQHEFGAKLGLGTYRKPKEKIDKKPVVKSIRNRTRKSRGDDDAAGELDFDMFLSMEQDWHEVHVQTVKERVRFAKAGEVVPPRGDNAADGSTKLEELCRPIAKTKMKALQRLVLKLTSGQLFEMGFEKSNFRIDKTAEPISLSRCFEERQEFFTEKTKRILSLIIGYTVLHLNGTSWLQPGWGSANIKFFQTTSCKTPLRPFIQTQLPKASPTSATPDFQLVVNGGDGDDDCSDELDSGHRCPALVALAVVLMEVYFVKPFKKLAEMHDIPLIKDSGSITLIDVDQVFNGDEEIEKEGWRSQIPEDSPLLTAIDNSLDGELWEDDEGAALDSGTLRSRIYQHVVRPLEIHLTHGFSQIPLDGVDKYARGLDFGKWGQIITSHEPDGYATTVHPGMVTPTRTPSPALMLLPPSQVGVHPIKPDFWKHTQYSQFHSLVSFPAQDLDSMSNPEVDYKASQFFDGEMGDGEYSVAETKRYLTWRAEYEKVYEKFIKKHLPDPLSQPVKIAILDTGIDQAHYAFEAREENLKGKRNCYNESKKNVPDLNGHGTFAASLILDYAPDAELYVVKIADENARPDGKIVANAINHAVDKWDVDIISMSFGWPSSDFEGYDALEVAIDKAYGNKVLMFAAAANSGGRLGRAYPASSSHIICVHSSNTYGAASDFSPTAEPNAINIATVGESVQSAWPMLLCRDKSNPKCVESRSGTSYATPIIAGITAFLLQYARLHLPESAALALKRKERMEALLRRCAERGPNYKPRDGYFYVELSLSGHNLFGEELEWVNHEILKALKV
ncbi:hypothetical protein F5883DRAFT_266502 [Diaporthe sp. PMI_573]|nr:hypothetical protein F5883DRAFT_266502 [Diaporthaceae sp. PMI_573]